MSGNRPAIKAILLDLFDTAIYCPWNELRREMAIASGVPVKDLLHGYARTQAGRNTGIHGSERRDLEEISRAGGLRLTDGQISALIAVERAYLGTHGNYYPDVASFLQSIKRAGIASGVISNCSYGAATLIDRLQVRSLVDHVFLSFEVGFRKPDPEIYQHALKVLGTDPGQALFIDDQPEFCSGALAVGMPALLIRRSITDGERMPCEHPQVSALDISLVKRITSW